MEEDNKRKNRWQQNILTKFFERSNSFQKDSHLKASMLLYTKVWIDLGFEWTTLEARILLKLI